MIPSQHLWFVEEHILTLVISKSCENLDLSYLKCVKGKGKRLCQMQGKVYLLNIYGNNVCLYTVCVCMHIYIHTHAIYTIPYIYSMHMYIYV